MSQTCQNITGTCAATINVNPSGSTAFDVAPATGPWSNLGAKCPSGQSGFIARQNLLRPFYYTCATTLDEAKSIFASQGPSQIWPLQHSQILCNSGGNKYITCSYSANGSSPSANVSAQTINNSF